MKIKVEAHRDKAGNWVGQVILAGRVLHEETGPTTPTQAIDNATSAFASLLAGAIERQMEYEVGRVE